MTQKNSLRNHQQATAQIFRPERPRFASPRQSPGKALGEMAEEFQALKGRNYSRSPGVTPFQG
jgi:hypothetical protein